MKARGGDGKVKVEVKVKVKATVKVKARVKVKVEVEATSQLFCCSYIIFSSLLCSGVRCFSISQCSLPS